jgi:non-ribosomal peptide synthase protein (TIGR01720 family)
MRYLHPSASVRQQFRQLGDAEISFNYLGQLDQALAESRLYTLAPESVGSVYSPRGQRKYLIAITGSVIGSQLRLQFEYSNNIHHRATIEKLANDFIDALHEIISHCASPDAGGYTPSDFPLIELNQEELEHAFEHVEFNQ